MTPVPTVSIIIPNYNYARFLEECVESVLAQEGADLRVLIIDDASSDESVEVASRLKKRDARVELRVHATNQGHIDTYNEGLAWATAQYVMILDSDDVLTTGALRRACDLLEAHPQVGLIYGLVRVFFEPKSVPRVTCRPPRHYIHSGREWFEGRCRSTENSVFQSSVVMRTSLIKQIGNFHRELPHTADMEMWLRVALCADVGYIGHSYQAYYRSHSAAMHVTRFGSASADLIQVREAFEILFREQRARIVNADELEASISRTLARRALDSACRLLDSGREDPSELSKLEDFALSTYAQAPLLSEWMSLRWRKVIGTKASAAIQPLLLYTIAKRSWRRVKRFRLRKLGLL